MQKPGLVFNNKQENELKSYSIKCSKIMYGLSPLEIRKLAYQCANKFGLKYPSIWSQNQRAGKDWFTGFRKRHPTLSIREPEPTSLARGTSFNKKNVSLFFEKFALY